MAIMIPTLPYGFKPESREDEMFYSLERLPDDYFVFYSFKMAGLTGNTWKEKEKDFVIYNRKKGILIIEAKAGKVSCDHGIWRYSNKTEMHDPFRQANDDGRWLLKKKLEETQPRGKDNIVNRCKFHFAVWFPSISKKGLDYINWPQDADPNVVMTMEDLDDPKKTIDRIFSYDVLTPEVQTNLSDEDHRFILDSFFCPMFEILPPKSYELDYKQKRFDAMIAEQSNILNYLEYQRNAVINGAAGTGKTMIAVEKARRHSANGESVLFLCFNNKLKEHLEKAYPYDRVSYYTIDGFACKMCSSSVADYNDLENVLLEYSDDAKSFPYQHIIVDEGQDFGQERMHTDLIFELLEEIVLKTDNGTFYVFYDKLQMIQSEKLPDFIENADCRLTLYKNCRNTKRIAETSFKPLQLNRPPKMFDSCMTGDKPTIAFCDSKTAKSVLDKFIRESFGEGMENIQVVSCAADGKSIYSSNVTKGMYKQGSRQIPFTTVRKFKGLEADHVILVDIDKNIIENDSMLFYVGSSRAKFQLSVVAMMDDEDCTEVLKAFGSSVKKKDPKGTLTKLFGCQQLDQD